MRSNQPCVGPETQYTATGNLLFDIGCQRVAYGFHATQGRLVCLWDAHQHRGVVEYSLASGNQIPSPNPHPERFNLDSPDDYSMPSRYIQPLAQGLVTSGRPCRGRRQLNGGGHRAWCSLCIIMKATETFYPSALGYGVILTMMRGVEGFIIQNRAHQEK